MATKKAAGTTAKKTAKAGSGDTEVSKPEAKSAPAKTATKSAAKKSADVGSDMKTSSKKTATHEEIAKHAHSLWEKSGHHHGSHVDHWLRAEKELKG